MSERFGYKPEPTKSAGPEGIKRIEILNLPRENFPETSLFLGPSGKVEVRAYSDEESESGISAIDMTTGKVYNLKEGANIIGRSEDCDIIINAPTVSRKHADIRVEEEVTISDLGSTNGTYLNLQ